MESHVSCAIKTSSALNDAFSDETAWSQTYSEYRAGSRLVTVKHNGLNTNEQIKLTFMRLRSRGGTKETQIGVRHVGDLEPVAALPYYLPTAEPHRAKERRVQVAVTRMIATDLYGYLEPWFMANNQLSLLGNEDWSESDLRQPSRSRFAMKITENNQRCLINQRLS